MRHKKFVSAVAYIHNSQDYIENFLKTIYNVFNNNFDNFEIICVNDSSDDNSGQIIRNFAGSVSGCVISMINTGFYQGLETSMLAGLDLAIGDFVFEFDNITADYNTELIMKCYERSVNGFDIVSCENDTKRMSSRIFYSLYNRHSGTQHVLKSEIFRVISRRGINRVYSMSPNPVYRKALYQNCGLKTDYIKYEGKSSESIQMLKNPQDTALTGLILFTDVAYKAAVILTVIMMLSTLGSIGYVITVYILGNPVEGYTTMMILLSGAFFGIFAVLAVIIKYLSVILHLIFKRQKYIIESVEKLT